MSPRRNARALVSRPRATRGKTRALGQHFLRDEAIARRIVGLVAPTTRDLVVGVGPGRGALTDRLIGACGRLLALEVDPDLAASLRERLGDSRRVEILDADARGFDWTRLRERLPDPRGRALVVGNLPYSVG